MSNLKQFPLVDRSERLATSAKLYWQDCWLNDKDFQTDRKNLKYISNLMKISRLGTTTDNQLWYLDWDYASYAILYYRMDL